MGPNTVPPPNSILAQTTGGWFDQGRQKWVAIDAALTILRVEVALVRYKKDHERFPAALEMLSPAYLTAIPVDPCGGRPLHYALRDGGGSFQLYSIGVDLRDNKGVPGKNIGASPGDIVAGKLFNYGPILYPGPVNFN